MTGFIYIMSNASMGRRIKIGKSDRDPIYRRDELSNTSVPEPFVIEYTAFVDDHHGAERKIHASLRDHRPNKGREFFEIPIAEAIALIRQSCSVIREDIHYKSPEEIHQAEAARRRQELEKEKYDQLIREQNERVDTWVSKSNKNAEFRRQRHLEKRREKVLAIVGVGAMVAIALVIDHAGEWAIAGTVVVAWFVHSAWINSIKGEAFQLHPDVSRQDYVEPTTTRSNASSPSMSRVRCKGCNVLVNVPAGKHLNITCPRCRTTWVQET